MAIEILILNIAQKTTTLVFSLFMPVADEYR